jgi:hypothetical protein
MPSFTVKAGAILNIDLPARYILIDSVTRGLSIILKGRSAHLDLEYVVRGGGKLSGLPEVVSNWVLDNRSNSVDVDVVLQGGEVFYDENRLDGDINALTRFDNLTDDGNAYVFSGYMAGVAGNHGCIEIFNPASSGLEVVIERIKFWHAGTNVVGVRTTANFGSVSGAASNKISSSSVSNSLTGTFSHMTPYLAGINGNIATLTAANNAASLDYKNTPPVLREGEGLLLYGSTTNQATSAMVEFIERSAQ